MGSRLSELLGKRELKNISARSDGKQKGVDRGGVPWDSHPSLRYIRMLVKSVRGLWQKLGLPTCGAKISDIMEQWIYALL